jgi:hypothetical protein
MHGHMNVKKKVFVVIKFLCANLYDSLIQTDSATHHTPYNTQHTGTDPVNLIVSTNIPLFISLRLQAIASNGGSNRGWIGKDLKDMVTEQGTTPTFAGRKWVIQWKISVRIAGVRAKIWIWNLQNTK